jgi:multiple sugar transport system ATP-binding protein
MAQIELEGVTKRYPDGFEAVKEMDLVVADGEFMILVGPSGSGKSTALRMIAGLEDITEGVVKIGGRRANELAPRERDIAMVFQSYALYPHMTVRENIGFALELGHEDAKERDRKVTDAARILGLEEYLDRKPANLSGGQRQRVAMGRAIVREPQAFLLDEPLSNLDAKLRLETRSEISRLQKRLGTTTIYVTHDQTEAMTLGDRVAVMRAGVVQQVDTPFVLYDDPVNLFVAGFIGSPSMNFVLGSLEGDTVRLPFGDAPLPAGLRARFTWRPDDGEVIAGLRPEHFEDATVEGSQPDRLRFGARIESVEWTGAELFAYFEVRGRAAQARELDELALLADDADAQGAPPRGEQETQRLVARLSPRSHARAGADLELSLDCSQMTLYSPHDGRSFTAARS